MHFTSVNPGTTMGTIRKGRKKESYASPHPHPRRHHPSAHWTDPAAAAGEPDPAVLQHGGYDDRRPGGRPDPLCRHWRSWKPDEPVHLSAHWLQHGLLHPLCQPLRRTGFRRTPAHCVHHRRHPGWGHSAADWGGADVFGHRHHPHSDAGRAASRLSGVSVLDPAGTGVYRPIQSVRHAAASPGQDPGDPAGADRGHGVQHRIGSALCGWLPA